MRLLVSLLLLVAVLHAQDRRVKNVLYGRKDGLALTMDVFFPEKANGGAVLFVVSSGWFSSDRMIRPRRFEELGKRGYTVFAVVHGSTPKYTIAEIVPDIHRAVRHVRHGAGGFGIDAERIGIFGGSAGGHLSLLIGTAGTAGNPTARDPVERKSSRVQAVAAFFPPTDFLNWGKPEVKITDTIMMKRFRAPFDFKVFDRTTNSYLPVKDPTPILRSISPIEHVSKDDPPTLLILGTRDPLVPLLQSELLFAKLEQTGVKTRLLVRKGKTHGWRWFRDDLKTVADWFDKHLAPPAKPG